MKNWSINLLFDEPKISSKTMIPFSYSFRGLISSLISLILILEFEYCSGGDLVIIYKYLCLIYVKEFLTSNMFFQKKMVQPKAFDYYYYYRFQL